jgi:hypothetical protein
MDEPVECMQLSLQSLLLCLRVLPQPIHRICLLLTDASASWPFSTELVKADTCCPRQSHVTSVDQILLVRNQDGHMWPELTCMFCLISLWRRLTRNQSQISKFETLFTFPFRLERSAARRGTRSSLSGNFTSLSGVATSALHSSRFHTAEILDSGVFAITAAICHLPAPLLPFCAAIVLVRNSGTWLAAVMYAGNKNHQTSRLKPIQPTTTQECSVFVHCTCCMLWGLAAAHQHNGR